MIVGRGLRRRAVLHPRCLAGDIGRREAHGQDRLRPSQRAGLAAVDARRMPERLRERGRVAFEHIRPVVVVHGERSTLLQVIADRTHRLQREQVALQTEPALPRDERQRVGQGEQDEVVASVGPLQERPAVVDVDRHPRVLVRMLRMQVAAEPLQHGIDLHRIDVLRAVGERQGDVVPAAGPDDQDVLWVRPADGCTDTCRTAGRRGARRAAPWSDAAGC